MTLTLGILGSLGGVIALLTLIFVIGRGIFKQISSTEENTQTLNKVLSELEAMKAQVSRNETRLAVIEDRQKREPRGRAGSSGQ